MIPESIIEKAIDQISALFDTPEYFKSLADSHEGLFTFLISKNDELLYIDEQDYQFFLASVILHAITSVSGPLGDYAVTEYEMKEEQNWAIWNGESGNFENRVNAFFIEYPEEDLLAFVEDALGSDDPGVPSEPGKAFIWIKLKSMIDVLTEIDT